MITEKLLAIQQELKAPKNQRNSFGNYNYRSCEDILEAVKPICRSRNAVLFLSDEIKAVGDRYYIEATARLVDVEDPNSSIAVTAYAREEESKKGMDAAQITGSASSYARKYALNGLFDIDDSKIEATPDPDTQDNTKEVQKPKFICVNCGSELKPCKSGGKEISIREVAERTTKKYGKCLCLKCAKAADDASHEG